MKIPILSRYRKPGSGTLVYGDPDFDLSLHEKEKDTLSAKIGPTPDANGCALPFLHENTARWPRLPETGKECELAGLLLGGISPPATIRLEKEALKERFKAEVGGKRFVYIATHGFRLGGDDEGASKGTVAQGDPSLDADAVTELNQLLLSGLVFAGANTFGEKPPATNRDNGWLTAQEISCLDLDGVELVVLSACSTGLGSDVRGEGIFGLRRAFLHAGVSGLVMSLWEIPDRETNELMTEFCRHLKPPAPLPRAEALRQAQISLMRKVKDRYGAPHPLFWAGFIYDGVWD